MLFTQLECMLFLFVVVLLFFFVKKNTYRKAILLCSNIYFYAYFDYRMTALLLLSVCVTYCISYAISKSCNQKQKVAFLATGILANVVVLAFFKYFNFFIENINHIVSGSLFSFDHLNIIVPLGISFYTFRFISYLVDVYRGEMGPRKSVDFMIYGTFFPIIVSGPISRASSFLPQLSELRVSGESLYKGYRLFVIGLFLKVFIADRVASYVNYFYSNNELFGTVTAWLAVAAYSVEIYCDFAGYSSMAIGIACMLGIRIEENFNFPYLAENIQDFWRRWHITLSDWIKDYLYIPLGGSRKGVRRQYVNYLTVMALCGLWHGAAWTFVLWGCLHGVMLVVHNIWRNAKYYSASISSSRCYTVFAKLLTFLSVTLCWVLFRSENMEQFLDIMVTLFAFDMNNGMLWVQPFVVFILLSFFVFHLLVDLKLKFVTVPLESKMTPTVLLCFLWLIVVFSPEKFEPFVYLQF
ncbi:MAG TPA: MBOAT family protein [Desulfobacterales bacterium]|nr:MBOAT family protein [Desulfobacterales bacterium]HIP38354.1 MBOAT family protein [Desulfocapsa sulfexigens]